MATRPCYTSVAWLWLRADAGAVRLTDGRAGVVMKAGNGTWYFVFAGVTYSPYTTMDSAIEGMGQLLANEGIMLRRRG